MVEMEIVVSESTLSKSGPISFEFHMAGLDPDALMMFKQRIFLQSVAARVLYAQSIKVGLH